MRDCTAGLEVVQRECATTPLYTYVGAMPRPGLNEEPYLVRGVSLAFKLRHVILAAHCDVQGTQRRPNMSAQLCEAKSPLGLVHDRDGSKEWVQGAITLSLSRLRFSSGWSNCHSTVLTQPCGVMRHAAPNA